MSDYHRIYMKLADLVERGHAVQLEKNHGEFEVTVFERWAAGNDHEHTNGELLSEVMDVAHRKALARWPKEDD